LTRPHVPEFSARTIWELKRPLNGGPLAARPQVGSARLLPRWWFLMSRIHSRSVCVTLV
jgi:hypothetical protein